MLGRVIEIHNNYCYIEKNNIKANIINLYVKIINDNEIYIGEVTNINPQYIIIKLCGEIINKHFIFGIRKKPNIDNEVYLLNNEEINIIFGINDYIAKKSLYIGKSSLYDNYPIYANMDNLFSNHLVILGNTGSGKSCGLARILQNLFWFIGIY